MIKKLTVDVIPHILGSKLPRCLKPQEIAEKVDALIINPEFCQKLGQNGSQICSN